MTGPTPSFGSSAQNTMTCADIISDFTCKELNRSDCYISVKPDPDDYNNGNQPPGEYCVQIQGCNPSAAVTQCKSVEVCYVVEDPCDPPEDIQPPNFIDQVFKLKQLGQGYDAPEFTSSPEYCPVTYKTTITKFTDSDGSPN